MKVDCSEFKTKKVRKKLKIEKEIEKECFIS
jgi:hypothetical protein